MWIPGYQEPSSIHGASLHRRGQWEPFRPFAPAVLKADASRWFALDVDGSPFMLLTPTVPARTRRPDLRRHPRRRRCPRANRRPDANLRFATLTTCFKNLTGVPVVLNASFNDREPIVETPADALATFQAIGLDALCIGDFLVRRAR